MPHILLAMDIRRNFDTFLKQKYKFSFHLKDEQLEILENIVIHKKHTLGILPTGFGKSICYVLPPLLINSKSIALIITPLVSLMTSQCQKYDAMGISSEMVKSCKDMTEETISGIEKGLYQLLFISPEALLKTDVWRKLILQNEVYEENLCVIAVDEVHLLEQWGDQFRPVYRCVGELQSHFSDVPYLLLTGTCTEALKQTIFKQLYLCSTSVSVIAVSCDRPNIFLEIRTVVNSPEEEFRIIIDDVRANGRSALKTIIYVRNIIKMSNSLDPDHARNLIGPNLDPNVCKGYQQMALQFVFIRSFAMLGRLLTTFMSSLTNEAYHQDIQTVENRLIDTYHSGLYISDQERIVNTFVKEDSSIRVLICTVAFGMGIDIPDVRRVYHWGCSNSFMEYWQEIGRAGRDGQSAEAVCLSLPLTIHVDSSMKELIKSFRRGEGKCIRQAVLHELKVQEMVWNHPEVEIHCPHKCDICVCRKCVCCSYCRNSCPCNSA